MPCSGPEVLEKEKYLLPLPGFEQELFVIHSTA